jgi:hypothetical protein
MAGSKFSRSFKLRVVGKKFIIICEGKSEYNYFQSVRASMELPVIQIQIANPGASDPRSIVNEAIRIRRVNHQEGRWADEDSAWAVYDGDEHIQNDPNNWNDAKQLADANKINLAVSNPSFELWLLLHYQDQFSNLHRARAVTALKRHLNGKYAKGDVIFPDPLLEPRKIQAAARAQRLAEQITRNGLDRQANPSTGIYRLVENLAELAR